MIAVIRFFIFKQINHYYLGTNDCKLTFQGEQTRKIVTEIRGLVITITFSIFSNVQNVFFPFTAKVSTFDTVTGK